MYMQICVLFDVLNSEFHSLSSTELTIHTQPLMLTVFFLENLILIVEKVSHEK
jgi:hypothetical protein